MCYSSTCRITTRHFFHKDVKSAISGRGPALFPLLRGTQGTVRLPLRPPSPRPSPPKPGASTAPIPTAEASPQLSRAQNTGQQRALGTGPFIICCNYYLPAEGRAAAEALRADSGAAPPGPAGPPARFRVAGLLRMRRHGRPPSFPPSLPRRSPAVPPWRNVWVEVAAG